MTARRAESPHREPGGSPLADGAGEKDAAAGGLADALQGPSVLRVLAIDPGPEQSACVGLDAGGRVQTHSLLPNADLCWRLRVVEKEGVLLAVEMVASYGMPVGEEVFRTVLWIGRFIEAWNGPHLLIPRLEVKMHLCHDSRARDSNIRRALLDRFGPAGTRRAPGDLYGVSGHGWSALALAVTVWDRLREGK
jgi:hypothetical protein